MGLRPAVTKLRNHPPSPSPPPRSAPFRPSRLKNVMKLIPLVLLPLALGVALATSAVRSADVAATNPSDSVSAAAEVMPSLPLPAKVAEFTTQYCSDCHNATDKTGGLDLTSLKFTPGDPANYLLWVKVHDRLEAKEMPPKVMPRPDAGDSAAFLGALTSALTDYQKQVDAREGRSTQRRLNRWGI